MKNIRAAFAQAAKTVTSDPAITNRHYMAFRRIVDANAAEDLEQQAMQYVETHMPTENAVQISADLLGTASEFSVINYMRANDIAYEDTLLGYFVPQQTLKHLESILHDVKPVKIQFFTYATANGLEATPAAYHRFSAFAKARGVRMMRIKRHPLYVSERDFCATNEGLDGVLELWCQLQKADIPSPVQGYIPLAEAAAMLKCSDEDVLTYIEGHPQYSRVVEHQRLIDADHIEKLTAEMDRLIPLTPLVTQVAKENDYQIGKSRAVAERYIVSDHPDWARPGADYPGKKGEEYYYPEAETDTVKRCLRDLIERNRMYPIQNLQAITQYPCDVLCRRARENVIHAEAISGTYYVSYDEIARIRQISDRYICLDDALAGEVLQNPCFDLGLVKVRNDYMGYLEANNCFGVEVIPAAGIPLNGKRLQRFILGTESEQLARNSRLYIRGYGLSAAEKLEILLCEYAKQYPRTIQDLRSYQPAAGIQYSEESLLTMVDRLLQSMDHELDTYDEESIQNKLVASANDLPIVSRTLLFDFLSQAGYTKRHYHVPATGNTVDTSAYSLESYATMVAAVTNREIWDEYDLVAKAVANPRYADAWLYLALHVYAAWRTPDYVQQIRVPHLRYDAETTLEKIKNGQYSESDMIYVATMCLEGLKANKGVPSKTKRFAGIAPLYLYCPEDCKATCGMILSISTAHVLLTKRKQLVNKVTDLRTFRDFLGEPMAKALGYKPFSSRRANKALLQLVADNSKRMPGCIAEMSYGIASRMRSHKAGYGALSETTAVYLQDTPLGRYPVQRVVEMLFDRGICSFAVDAMLKNCYGAAYQQLSVEQKNDIICNLGLTPAKADTLQRYVLQAEDDAIEALRNISNGSKAESEMAIAAILCDDAMGKDQTSNCLCAAMGQNCKQPQRQRCLGCPYEVRTKSMLVSLCRTLYQQQEIIQDAHSAAQEREKAMWICEHVLQPVIVEIYEHLDPRTAKDDAALYAEIARDCRRDEKERT